MTLAIGRWRKESSPERTLRNWLPASSPVRMRIVVPLLPQFSTSPGSNRPWSPNPSITAVPESSGQSMRAPIATRQAAVDRTSSDSRRDSTVALPEAMLLRMSARCEIDLSLGTRMVARMRAGRLTITLRLFQLL